MINGSNALQGVGGTGGVVNTVTRSPVRNAGWQTTAQARVTTSDNFDSDSLGHKLSVMTGRGGDTFDFIAGLAVQERGLFLDPDSVPVGLYPTQGDIMDSTSLSLFGKAEWRIDDINSLEIMVNDFDLERNGNFRSVPGDRDAGIPTGTTGGSPAADVGAVRLPNVHVISSLEVKVALSSDTVE